MKKWSVLFLFLTQFTMAMKKKCYRKNIPDAVRSIVLGEAGYQCAYCGQRDGMNLTLHHIISERDGGKAEAANLIALCFNCHHKVQLMPMISGLTNVIL